MIGHDAVFAMADLCVEAEAIGCEITYPENNYPHIKKIVLHDFSELDSLNPPDPTSAGRMPELLKATRLLKKAVGGVIPVIAHATGPMTIAARIMDIEQMLYMIVDHPDRFRSILRFCCDVSRNFAVELVKAGADGILIFDPAASPSVLPARIFNEFEMNQVKSIFSYLKARDPDIITWYSVAGPTQTNYQISSGVDSDIFTADYVTPIDVALTRSNAVVINGNIKPALFLEGSASDIYEEALKLLSIARPTERFILGSGCEIPLYSKLENIKALVKAAEDERNIFDNVNSHFPGSREVTILPHRKKVFIQKNRSVLDAIQKAKISVTSYCDKSGACGKCVALIKRGAVSQKELIETSQLNVLESASNERLACRAKVVDDDVGIYIPYFSRVFRSHVAVFEELIQKTITNELEHYGFSPRISCKTVDCSELSGVKPALYGKWLENKLGSYKIESRAIKGFVSAISSKRNEVFAIIDKGRGEVIDFSISDKVLGLAVDIGTTTISAYIHNLGDGKLVCFGSLENPQTQWGLNVISRVAYLTQAPETLDEMQMKLIEGINKLIESFYYNNSIDYNNIYEVVVVGNPIITHLFLGQNPESLSKAPFTSTVSRPVPTFVESLGLNPGLSVNSDCRLETLPSIGGFVGADTVAGIIASGVNNQYDISLFIDIGTNGEVALGNRDHLICTSVAAGPAFEGTHLTNGHMYQNGVIRSVGINSASEIVFKTVGDGAPIGLCGSSIIDAIAEFLRHGIINQRGHFVNKSKWSQIKGDIFVLVNKEDTAMFSPICVSSADIEEIQKAKSAFLTGITLLMKEMDISPQEVKHVYISGAFGFSLNMDNAKRIGMIPDLPWAKFEFINNSAGMGARLALLSRSARDEAEKIADSARHINLANHKDFTNLFIDNMFFPA